MYCGGCGKGLEFEANYCKYCGRKINTTSTQDYTQNIDNNSPDLRQSIGGKRQTVSIKMQKRLRKIDLLISKGYKLKQQFGCPNLIGPDDKPINLWGIRDEDAKSFPGYSPIAIWVGPFIAVKFKAWYYFAFLVIAYVISLLGVAIFSMPYRYSFLSLALVESYFGQTFPYYRWLFLKSNKHEISNINSILIASFLSFIIMLFIIGGFE